MDLTATAKFTRATLGKNAGVNEIFQRLLDMKETVRVLICEDVLSDDDVENLEIFLRRHHNDLNLTSIQLPNNRLTANASSAIRDILCTTQTLRDLDIRHNRLGVDGFKRVVEAIVFLESTALGASLTSLNVVDNELRSRGASEIARLIRHSKTVEELYVGQNALGCHAIREWAQAMKENKTLQILSLPNNNLKGRGISSILKEGLEKNSSRRLRWLDLECNQLGSTGAQALENFLLYDKTLEVLKIGSNDLGIGGAKAFKSVLIHNSTLKELRLSGNSIGNEGAEAIGQGLASNTFLQILYLDWNLLEDTAVTCLANALRANSTLLHLNLSNNRIACDGITELTNSLAYNISLEVLNIEGNRMRDTGAFCLAQAIGFRKSTLKNLGWNDNPLSETGAAALDHAFVFRTNLEWMNNLISTGLGTIHLDLLDKDIGDEEVIHLISCLKTASHKKLRSISLTGKNIMGRGIQSLASWLCDGTVRVERLCLFKTRTGDGGARALGHALESNKSLKVLNVTDCQITAAGGKALAHGLSRNSTLERLTLTGNSIGDDGFLELAKALQLPSSAVLQALNVTKNGIGDAGMVVISKTSLKELYMQQNEITDEGALDLAKGFLKDCQLQCLDLSKNVGITHKGRGALRACLPSGCCTYF